MGPALCLYENVLVAQRCYAEIFDSLLESEAQARRVSSIGERKIYAGSRYIPSMQMGAWVRILGHWTAGKKLMSSANCD